MEVRCGAIDTHNCSAIDGNCYESRCCQHKMDCYQEKPGRASCLDKCTSDDKPGWDCLHLYSWQLTCAESGKQCMDVGCCKNPAESCYSKNASYAVCLSTFALKVWKHLWYTTATTTTSWDKLKLPWKKTAMYKGADWASISWKSGRGHTCNSRFVPPEAPLHATDLNGHHLPDVCINGTGPHHVFAIGDWGGILGGHKGNEHSNTSKPADHTPFGAHKRWKKNVDNFAQHRVASAMARRAPASKPDYILNVGDAFYWGGVETRCGLPPFQHADTLQWRVLFEEMYTGEGIDGVQWLGVLGNHDYGGWMFTAGWDQTIGYTWARGPGSTRRWMMPAQYWSVKVHYPDSDFSVDYFFVDSNVFDADTPYNPSFHNICNLYKSGGSQVSCGPTGPKSAYACPSWFKRLWNEQVKWLDDRLPDSTAEWQIVVTHFPPVWGREDWMRLAHLHGIDLIITGHRHRQEVHYMEPDTDYDGWPGLKSNFLDPTAWIVTGGGGGVTSENYPDDHGHDDQYGFVDLTLSKNKIEIEMLSHGHELRHTKTITRWVQAKPTPDPKKRTEAGNEGSSAMGCGNKEHTFYLYRAQSESDYPDENINAASLAGVLWYLHHEVVIVCPRKFGITRLRRLKVTMRNTCELYKDKQTQFGPYVPFDTGRCTTPQCDEIWNDYGAVVGCQHIPFNSGIFAAYCRQPSHEDTYEHCAYAQWFSLPGPCPSQSVNNKSKACKDKIKGGFCNSPTGQKDCTYHVEDAGEINIDDLYDKPIGDMNAFCGSGKMEYNNQTDHGVGINFWDGIYNPLNGQARIKAVRERFKKKYPHMPERLSDPHCDFFETDPTDYLIRTGSGFQRIPA